MTKRKLPGWIIPFLRALARTGDVRASAEDAGIDHTTAYARRRAHADFAADWDEALRARAQFARRQREEELQSFDTLRTNGAPPSPANAGEELVAAGSQLKRAGHGRWGKRKEQAFLAELAATGNLKRASRAAGISYEAVRMRRRRDPQLEAACQAAIRACRARIPEFLAGAAAATFDPNDLPEPEGNPLPKVTVSEAIKIAQLNGAKGTAAAEPEDDPDCDYDQDMADIREQIVQKLQRIRRLDRVELQQRGWSYDESWDVDVPPGWAKTPEWRPMRDGDRIY